MFGIIRWMSAIVLILGLGLSGGGLYAHNQVSSQLQEQRITMPEESQLPTQEQREALGSWAGQQLTTGPQAKAFADHYVAVHLQQMAGGRTYSEIGEDEPELKAKVFEGQTVRATLLTAYAFWALGSISLWSGVVLLLLGVLGAVIAIIQRQSKKSVGVRKNSAA
ncbi:hypothetical protein GP475_08395 [Corynebacterium poyangense]|uniref:Uncharacterized protein n=1 Tax=Corynebacterium poyangense TaxID=2684405 RepID=A0A7H0SQ28_9CORY|nr:hypothetical protein [Corynebacterium poyangense]MBZ8178414.1 hypothetical protein [Corynebacterium poyangense]QNQ90653.1 hypothetical protein GP475_08395 [Corynebacterium poyangense]